MEYGKYIITESLGHEVAVLFDALISHDLIAVGLKVISAGFFVVSAEPREGDKEDIGVCVFGKSITLKIECRKGEDEIIIKRILRKEF